MDDFLLSVSMNCQGRCVAQQLNICLGSPHLHSGCPGSGPASAPVLNFLLINSMEDSGSCPHGGRPVWVPDSRVCPGQPVPDLDIWGVNQEVEELSDSLLLCSTSTLNKKINNSGIYSFPICCGFWMGFLERRSGEHLLSYRQNKQQKKEIVISALQ